MFLTTAQWLKTFRWFTVGFTAFSMVVSVPLYILIVVKLIHLRNTFPFNSHFFIAYVPLAIVDLICYALYIPKKIHLWGLTMSFMEPDTPYLWLEIHCMLLWWFGIAQYQLTIIVLSNRCVSVIFPKLYIRFWTARVTRNAVIFVLIETFFIAIPVLIKARCVVYKQEFTDDDGSQVVNYVGPLISNDVVISVFTFIWKTHIYIILVVGGAGYVFTYIKIQTFKNKQNSLHRSERGLLYSAVILLLANVLFAAVLISREYITTIYPLASKYVEWLLVVMADLYDLHNGYALVCTSRELRKALKKVFGLSAESSVAPVQIAGSSNQLFTRSEIVIH